MAEANHSDLALLTVGIYLAALVVGVVAFRRFGLGAAPGYLVLGAAAGPAALGLLAGNETIDTLAEFGVVLLLFVIGLELRPARVWSLRVDILGLGIGQVTLTTALFAMIVHAILGWDAGPCIVAGAALALSSTAFGIQSLMERNALGTRFADRAIAVLLFQDLAVVPLLALVSLFSAAGLGGVDASIWSLATALGSLLVLGLAGHYLINPFFRHIVRGGGDEAFTPAALLVVVGAALLMEQAGLSMAMGALIAGVLLAESEYRHRIESAIHPFRSLFLGLFFLGVGAQVDILAIGSVLHFVVGAAIGVFVLKAAVLFALARIRGADLVESIRIAALLGQAGEFGFVIFGLAAVNGIFTDAVASSLTAVAAVSMGLTVVAVRLAEWWITRIRSRDEALEEEEEEVPPASVIVVGFGRFGQTVARVLQRRGFAPLVLERSPERIRIARSQGFEAFFGDLDGSDFLGAAEQRGVRAIFVCANGGSNRPKAIARLRELFPDVELLARVPDRFTGWEALELGADHVERELFEASLSMVREGLTRIGDAEGAEEAIDEIRRDEAEQAEQLRAYTMSGDTAAERETASGDAPKGRFLVRWQEPDSGSAGGRRPRTGLPVRGLRRIWRRARSHLSDWRRR